MSESDAVLCGLKATERMSRVVSAARLWKDKAIEGP